VEALLRSDELPVISEIEVRNAMRCLDGWWLFGGKKNHGILCGIHAIIPSIGWE